MKITTQQQELRRGQILTLECQSGSSNPKANLSWSLGARRFGKAAGGKCYKRQWHMLISELFQNNYLVNLLSECQELLVFILLYVAICMIAW